MRSYLAGLPGAIFPANEYRFMAGELSRTGGQGTPYGQVGRIYVGTVGEVTSVGMVTVWVFLAPEGGQVRLRDFLNNFL